MGTSALGRSSPLCGVKTRAIPLLFERKNACYFSKTFVTYNKYREQEKKLLNIKRSVSNTKVSETSTRRGTLKKSHSYSDLGGLIKIMEIFETPHQDENS